MMTRAPRPRSAINGWVAPALGPGRGVPVSDGGGCRADVDGRHESGMRIDTPLGGDRQSLCENVARRWVAPRAGRGTIAERSTRRNLQATATQRLSRVNACRGRCNASRFVRQPSIVRSRRVDSLVEPLATPYPPAINLTTELATSATPLLARVRPGRRIAPAHPRRSNFRDDPRGPSVVQHSVGHIRPKDDKQDPNQKHDHAPYKEK